MTASSRDFQSARSAGVCQSHRRSRLANMVAQAGHVALSEIEPWCPDAWMDRTSHFRWLPMMGQFLRLRTSSPATSMSARNTRHGLPPSGLSQRRARAESSAQLVLAAAPSRGFSRGFDTVYLVPDASSALLQKKWGGCIPRNASPRPQRLLDLTLSGFANDRRRGSTSRDEHDTQPVGERRRSPEDHTEHGHQNDLLQLVDGRDLRRLPELQGTEIAQPRAPSPDPTARNMEFCRNEPSGCAACFRSP